MAKLLSTEMSERRLKKEYTALLCSYQPFFPFPETGVIRQSFEDPEELWSVQDTSAASSAPGKQGHRYICSPKY